MIYKYIGEFRIFNNELILSFENKSKKDLNENVELSFNVKSNIKKK